jgi:subtilisin family serine protease
MRNANQLYRLCLAVCLIGAASPTGAAPIPASPGKASPPIIAHTDRAAVAGGADATAARALLLRAETTGRLRVIVGLREPAPEESLLRVEEAVAQQARRRSRQLSLLAELGLPQVAAAQSADDAKLFDTIPFVALKADKAGLERLLANPQVASVQEDRLLYPTLRQSVPLTKAGGAAAQGFSGTGQVVAVLDTGVDKRHPMLVGKVVAEACYSTTVAGESTSLCPGGVPSSTAPGSGANCPASIPGCDHGTHVASISAGSSASLKGLAPGAKVIAIQVFSNIGGSLGAYTSDIIRGLERVHALRSTYKIASVNLSLGGGVSSTDCDSAEPATKAVIDKLRAARIATVIASGNDALDGFVSFPACISTAVAVGSTDKLDQVSFFSNHDAMVELLAPGSSIMAAVPGGMLGVKSGTSMATPHVAGAWAILKQAKPSAGVAEIQAALACTGKPVSRGGTTKPRLDVLKALNVLRSPAPGCR